MLTGAAAIDRRDASRRPICIDAFLTKDCCAAQASGDQGAAEALSRHRSTANSMTSASGCVALVDKRRAAEAVARAATSTRSPRRRRSRLRARQGRARRARFRRSHRARPRRCSTQGRRRLGPLQARQRRRAHPRRRGAGHFARAVEHPRPSSPRNFSRGAGAGRARRTFFAVGDEKQSIFSFQGAAPHLFDWMRRFFARRHARRRAALRRRASSSIPSAPRRRCSTRSTRCFRRSEVWRGVSAGEANAPTAFGDPRAVARRRRVLADRSSPEPSARARGLAAAARRAKRPHPAVALAERIAAVIAQWTAPGSPERVVDAVDRRAAADPGRRHSHPGAFARAAVRGADAGAASRAARPPAPTG